MTGTHPQQQLAVLRDGINAVSDSFVKLVGRVGPGAAAARPKADAWSATDCIVHLALTSESFFPGWNAALAKARDLPAQPDRPYKRDWTGRLLAWSLEPPARMKMKATAALPPAGSKDAEGALAAFLESQRQWLALLDGAERLALDQVRVVSPFASQVRYSLWSSFLIASAHQRRHLWQAEQAVASAPTLGQASASARG